jgi:hypothetical protein
MNLDKRKPGYSECSDNIQKFNRTATKCDGKLPRHRFKLRTYMRHSF